MVGMCHGNHVRRCLIVAKCYIDEMALSCLQGSSRKSAYLNFDAQLLQPPANGYIEGIVGEGYERLIKGEKEENDGEFHALAADYEMASYFRQMEPLAFAGGLGGRTARQDGETPARRLLIERHHGSRLQLPLHAGAHHGVKRYAKACLNLFPFTHSH